jgi:hypothetical protein
MEMVTAEWSRRRRLGWCEVLDGTAYTRKTQLSGGDYFRMLGVGMRLASGAGDAFGKIGMDRKNKFTKILIWNQ